MSIGTSIESAITGLFSGIEQARQTTADLSRQTSKLTEIDKSDSGDSPVSSTAESGLGTNVDVRV